MNINRMAENVIRAVIESLNEQDVEQEVYDDYAEVIRRLIEEKIGNAVYEVIEEKLTTDDYLPF